MTNYTSLATWRYKTIEDWGGVTSDSYKSFEKTYRNFIRRLCKNNGYNLVWFHGNHYEFTCMIESDNKYVYLSISDTRYFQQEWYKNILVRYAKHDKDYGGWHSVNEYTSLPDLENYLVRMFAKEPRFNG